MLLDSAKYCLKLANVISNVLGIINFQDIKQSKDKNRKKIEQACHFCTLSTYYLYSLIELDIIPFFSIVLQSSNHILEIE